VLEIEILLKLSGTCITKTKIRVSPAVLGGTVYILLHGLQQTAKHLL
jgi:hypothetical protein